MEVKISNRAVREWYCSQGIECEGRVGCSVWEYCGVQALGKENGWEIVGSKTLVLNRVGYQLFGKVDWILYGGKTCFS